MKTFMRHKSSHSGTPRQDIGEASAQAMRRGGPCAAALVTLPLASVPRLWAVSGSWARGHQRLGHPHGGSGRRRANWPGRSLDAGAGLAGGSCWTPQPCS